MPLSRVQLHQLVAEDNFRTSATSSRVMTYRRRIRWDEMAYTRNPSPARGPEVYSLDELRYYIRLFWKDRMYGVCHVQGGKSAFAKACGMAYGYFVTVFVDDPPKMQFLRADRQRLVSKAVRNVLTGKIHYETDPKNVRRAVGKYEPDGTPPQGVTPITRPAEWRLHWNRFGPRIDRIG
jgi:hypothetical protein